MKSKLPAANATHGARDYYTKLEMYHITLICTRHEECGKCNSDELYRIIETINPGIIFEEIPPTFFDKYYTLKTLTNLESETINKYLATHKIDHIPVDSDNLPSESFFQNYTHLVQRIEGLADINGHKYRSAIDNNKRHSATYGFEYLNSIYCDNLYDETDNAMKKGLQTLNDDKLFQTYKLWNDIHEKRENEMLKNIYSYSKDHSYDKGIFMIGAAHRKSIMKEIKEFEKKEELKLNWSFFNN
jgi:hypothetical protein